MLHDFVLQPGSQSTSPNTTQRYIQSYNRIIRRELVVPHMSFHFNRVVTFEAETDEFGQEENKALTVEIRSGNIHVREDVLHLPSTV